MSQQVRDIEQEYEETFDYIARSIGLVFKQANGSYFKRRIRALLRDFRSEEIMEALDIALCQYDLYKEIFESLGGIAYNRRKRRSEETSHAE